MDVKLRVGMLLVLSEASTRLRDEVAKVRAELGDGEETVLRLSVESGGDLGETVDEAVARDAFRETVRALEGTSEWVAFCDFVGADEVRLEEDGRLAAIVRSGV